MKWKIYDQTVFFPGDLNEPLRSELAKDERMDSDILKMPHHGGRGIAPNTFFDRVDPKTVLVPGPKWVWCGERGSRPRNWTIEHHKPTWVNGLHGNIVVTFTRGGSSVSAETPNMRCEASDQ